MPPKSQRRYNSDEPFEEKGPPMNKHYAHTKQFLALTEKSPVMAFLLGLARSPLFLTTVASVAMGLAGVPAKTIHAVKSEIAAPKSAK